MSAWWVKPSEEGRWLLSIASKAVDEKGPAAAYQAVHAALQGIPDTWVSLSEVKLLGANHPITKDVLEANAPHALSQIALVGSLMLALVGVHTLCTMFIDFRGHMMGARMESDMRQELFDHYQKL